jgi:hypothetical protein
MVEWRGLALRIPKKNSRYVHMESGRIYEVVIVSNLKTATGAARPGDDEKFPPTVTYRDTTAPPEDPLAVYSTGLLRWSTRFNPA